MAISAIANPVSYQAPGVATAHTFNFTVVDGTDRATVVRFAKPGSSPVGVVSVVLDPSGLAIPLVEQVAATDGLSSSCQTWIYTLPEASHPAAGTYQVEITLTAPRIVNAFARSWNGVNQALLGTVDGMSPPTPVSGNTATASITVASAVGELILDCISMRDGVGSPNTLAIAGGQIEDFILQNNQDVTGMSHIAGAASVTPSWSMTGQLGWELSALVLQPADTNTAPSVEITSPSAASVTVPTGTKIVLEFTATDPEDGDLTASAQVTSSNTDDGVGGSLGTGSPLTIDTTGWADGARTITVTATDSGTPALSGSDDFVLTVGAAATGGFDKGRFIVRAMGGIV